MGMKEWALTRVTIIRIGFNRLQEQLLKNDAFLKHLMTVVDP
jgi:hypothetical protein